MKAKNLSITGMLAALIFVLTMFVKIPVSSGYIHFGDALIYLGALLIDAPYIIIASAIGEALADLAGGYVIYIPATIIIKCLVALPFVFAKKKSQSKLLNKTTAVMTVPAGLITVGGYFIADLIIAKAYAVADLPGNVIQAVASAVAFCIFAFAIDKGKIKDKLGL